LIVAPAFQSPSVHLVYWVGFGLLVFIAAQLRFIYFSSEKYISPLALSHSPFLLTAFSDFRRSPLAVHRLRYFFILSGLAIQTTLAFKLSGNFLYLGIVYKSRSLSD